MVQTRRAAPRTGVVFTALAVLIFVLAVGAERLVEMAVSQRNLAWAYARGGREHGRGRPGGDDSPGAEQHGIVGG